MSDSAPGNPAKPIAPIPVQGPEFEIDAPVEVAYSQGTQTGKVDSRSWVELRDRPGCWQYSVAWANGSFSTLPEKDLWNSEGVRKAARGERGPTDDPGVPGPAPGGEMQAAYERGLRHDRDLPPCTCTDPKSQAHDQQCIRGIEIRRRRDEGFARELADGAGWQGTPPAEGTRRRLILNTIVQQIERTHGVDESVNTPDAALMLADSLESALLQSTIDAEAMERGAEGLIERIRDVELENDAQEAIANVGEVLDRIDAPQAPTFAQRIDRLYLEFREKGHINLASVKARIDRLVASNDRLEGICAERWTRIGELEEQLTLADVRRRLDKAREVDAERAHNLLDGWDVARTGPATVDPAPELEDGAAKYTLYQRVRELADRLRRTEADLETEMNRPMVAPEGRVAPGTRELHIVLAAHPGDDPSEFFVELEDQDGRGVGGFESRQGSPGTRRIVIPYARDDEWVQKLAMAAIVAGQDVDRPFPAEALDELLRGFGIVPTLPRDWPGREAVKAVLELPDDLVEEIVGEARKAVEGPRDDDADAAADEYVNRLLREREEARGGESRFAEERDCAYALLRWLLPVTVARRLDSIGEDD